jgi:DNA-directed RNA polymerase specialized sigma24 family protein
MTMTKMTDEALAAHAEALLDALNPDVAPADDPKTLRRIGLAARDIRAAEDELRQAVAAARTEGYTWAEIGMTLGVTRQAAQTRFGRPAHV